MIIIQSAKEFDEVIFKFIRKILPNLKTNDFKIVKNKNILLPKINIYPMMGNKGNNSPLDDYSERQFYSIAIKSNGYYKVILITEIYNHFYHTNQIIIEDVNCKEFYEKFERIQYDISKLLYEPVFTKPQPEINYCEKVMDLIGRR